MSQLLAIPTKYSGVDFRSRAEARWAVIFDRLGIPWYYEHEGFQLPTYWYLPDFWMPSLNCFAEVKGVAHQWDDEALIKATELAVASKRAVLLCDDPRETNPLVPALCPSAGLVERFHVDLCHSRDKGHLWVETDPFYEYLDEDDQWAGAVSTSLAHFRYKSNDSRA